MRVTVKLFAIVRQRAGVEQVEVELNERVTVRDAMDALAKKMPAIAELLPREAVAVNREYASPDRSLNDGDELAVIPAVSGGTA